MVWSGWDAAAGDRTANYNMTITLPVAKNADGSAITGPAYEYIVSGAAAYELSYPAATLDQLKAVLTHRVRLDDAPQVVPASSWAYDAHGTSIHLLPAGTRFTPGDIYELSYTAKDPTVNGIGFAAVRDFNAFLRYEKTDAGGNANPLAGDVTRIYTEVQSQPGRMLNDFRLLGFNQAENGKIVFDGMMQWVAAADGINMNYRFSQPGRTERNRQDHLYVEGVFPFANVETFDPIMRKVDSRYARCERSDTCPFGVEIYSANEYWVKAASLLHTDPTGSHDLPDSRFTRNYFISSHQHGTGNGASKGACQQFQNPLNSAPVQRALFIALDEWATEGRRPPASRVPTLRDHMLAPPLPQSGVGFPNIPGVTYNGLMTTRYLFDYGLHFYTTGIATINPPVITPPYQNNPANGPIYRAYVPKTDSDGNDIAGVRLVDVTVPLATYTGWALRAGERRLRRLGAVHPVPAHRGRPRRHRRSASFCRGALPDLRRLPREDPRRAERHGGGPAAAVRGHGERGRAPHAGGPRPRGAPARGRRAAGGRAAAGLPAASAPRAQGSRSRRSRRRSSRPRRP
jgi:hypothetical protein